MVFQFPSMHDNGLFEALNSAHFSSNVTLQLSFCYSIFSCKRVRKSENWILTAFNFLCGREGIC